MKIVKKQINATDSKDDFENYWYKSGGIFRLDIYISCFSTANLNWLEASVYYDSLNYITSMSTGSQFFQRCEFSLEPFCLSSVAPTATSINSGTWANPSHS